ncbi:MAG: hypothetical protein P8J74_05415 [Woeseiaceae bacterium]|nr:hypothetical protein [Woeseiaceae bacterium]
MGHLEQYLSQTFIFIDGRKYVGEFKDGDFKGQGNFTYADGTIEELIGARGGT